MTGGIADYESHDAVGLAEKVRKGEVTPGALLEAAIARVEARDGALNAVVVRIFEQARRSAAAALPDGPLRGVPFLIKDLHAPIAGVRMTNGSKLFEDLVPDHDSELVARYRRAGLVLFGRSASPELGVTTSTESALFGATRNPWSTAHSAGGSSGGAAAAVAAGMLPAAHASDGGGSIRIPASCCGLFGLKPTRARNPSGPDVGEGWSGMGVAHAITRSVRDSALLLDATQGPDLGAPYCAPAPERPYLEEVHRDPGRLRVAVQTESWNGVATHRDCAEAVRDAAQLCASLGHEVRPARLRIDPNALGRATQIVIAANLRAEVLDRAAALGRALRPDDIEPGTRALVEAARTLEAADYARAIVSMHAVGRKVARFFLDCDVLLTPTLPVPPPLLGRLALSNTDLERLIEDITATVGFTQLFNATGNPAMSVPLHWNAEGLPIGVQFAGRFGDEATLLRLAGQLEAARPWFERRPPPT
ncbi:MAG: amidase [Myxococcales bacterium]|nr:amidase [Myxococcales bacterium]